MSILNRFNLFIPMLTVFAFVASCKKTPSALPIVNTINTDRTNSYSAYITCLISADPGSTVVRGVIYAKHPNVTGADMQVTDPNIRMGNSGGISFTAALTSLNFSTTYYARAFAANKMGISYGEEISFTTKKDTTLQMGTMNDIDGNTYKTIVIDNKEWMAENLKVSHYRNGASIPVVTDHTTWIGLTSGAACWYNNDSAGMGNIYGKLYNFKCISDSQKICPQGWHVPNGSDWENLRYLFGGPFIAGGDLKSKGTQYWESPNKGATNSSGFFGLPSGIRDDDGSFKYVRLSTRWWSLNSTGEIGIGIGLSNYSTDAFYGGGGSQTGGYPLRCIKD